VKLQGRHASNRLQILEAAAQAFFERGFAATSLDDVADRLGSTKGRVHHYFPTKGEIFVAIHRRAMELALDALEPIANGSGTPSEKMRAVATAHAQLMMNESGFMRLSVQHAEVSLATAGQTKQDSVREVFKLRQKYEDIFEQIIKDGIASGEFREGNPTILGKAALGALNWMTVWYRPASVVDLNDRAAIADEVALFITSGLQGSPASAHTS
jgi:AcrR family transcriptional regulator